MWMAHSYLNSVSQTYSLFPLMSALRSPLPDLHYHPPSRPDQNLGGHGWLLPLLSPKSNQLLDGLPLLLSIHIPFLSTLQAPGNVRASLTITSERAQPVHGPWGDLAHENDRCSCQCMVPCSPLWRCGNGPGWNCSLSVVPWSCPVHGHPYLFSTEYHWVNHDFSPLISTHK